MDPVTVVCRTCRLGGLLTLTAAAALLGGCATTPPLAATRNQIIISVRDQKLTVVNEDHTRVSFPISTSKFGLGDRNRSYETPTGQLAVAAKIGGGAKAGTVFHGRVSTGEVVKVDAPGRDAIVSRILALKGLEAGNSKAFSRGIYIHGTPEERNIGRPTSYGCIRMRSRDVIALYDMVKVGALVQIIDTTQNSAIAANIIQPPPAVPASVTAATGAVANITNSSAQTVATTAAASPTNTAPANKKVATTTTTTIVTPGAQVPPPAKAKPPATADKKAWAGAPSKLLDKAAAADAKAKNAKPAASPQPVSNSAAPLNHPAVDSL